MPPTRDIDELVELHKREGAVLQEVFVEGREDKYFYESFLAENGLRHVAVLEVETVNVPDREVARLGLPIGKKGRVVTLAALLEGRLSENELVCVADADLDHFKGIVYAYSLLLITDYTSIELYALCPSVMGRILGVALGGFPKGYAQVVAEIAKLLEDSFLIRVAADDLGLGPTYPDQHSSYCKFDKRKKTASFNPVDYINKAFENYFDKSWRAPMNAKIAERRGQLKPEVRLQIHGHDFIDTLAWYIRQHAGFGHINPATFGGVLLGFVDAAALAREPLFRELLRRLRAA
jgi:hypothetical protein